MAEEIRNITFGLDGVELTHEQTIQRLVVAGFPLWRINPQGKAESPLLTMFAIIEGESGEYQRAWHINVLRNPDGTIARSVIDGVDNMRVKSVDLGFAQFNVQVSDFDIVMDPDIVQAWIDGMFESYPELAVPWDSATAAYQLWLRRGFQPWYAYQPGTAKFKQKMTYGSKALANYIVHKFVDPKLELDWK